MEHVKELVLKAALSMLSGNLTYFDGAREILDLKSLIKKDNISDEDFLALMIIYSETDYIPNAALRKYLKDEDLLKVEVELKKIELWAKPFAEDACKNLINKIGF